MSTNLAIIDVPLQSANVGAEAFVQRAPLADEPMDEREFWGGAT